MNFKHRLCHTTATLAVLAAAHMFGFEVEYIHNPEFSGFKSSECGYDCKLYGMLGGRLVMLSRDEYGTASLSLVPDDALAEAIKVQPSRNGEMSERAESITIEKWDEEFLAHLDTFNCVAECVVSVRFGNHNAHVYRDGAAKPKLAWVSEYEETILIPSTVSDPQTIILLTGGSGDCGGNGPDLGDPFAIDHSKTQTKQISCLCFEMYDDETKRGKSVAERTLQTIFFNCSGTPVKTRIETSELTLLNAGECPDYCDNYL